MSDQTELWAQIIKYWIYQSPFTGVNVVGAIVAMQRGGLSSRPFRLVLIGCTASLILSLVMPAAMIYFTWALSARGEPASAFLDAFSFVSNVITALAYSFILRSAFVERVPLQSDRPVTPHQL